MAEIRKNHHAGGRWAVLPPALCLLLACVMPAMGLDARFSLGECCVDEVGSSCCRDTACGGTQLCDADSDCSGNSGGHTICAGQSTYDMEASTGTSGSYPGSYSSCPDATSIAPQKGNSTSQLVAVGLWRWPTGTTLDGQTVTDCSIRMNVASVTGGDSRDFVCEWHTWTTCGSGEWTDTVGSTALSLPVASISTGDQTHTLDNCDANVNTTPGGFTGLRCGISGGSTTSSNYVDIKAYDDTSASGPGMRLVVGIPDPPTATPTNTVPTATPTNTPTRTPTNTPAPTHTPIPPTATPTPTAAPVVARADSVPESWWYDRAKCDGPAVRSVGGVLTHVGVCSATGGRWSDNVEAPGVPVSGLRLRVAAYKLAETSATGTLTVSCAAQCVRNNDAVSSTYGTAQTVSFSVGSYAKNDRMAAATTPIMPAGTCDALATILIECSLTAAPTGPALYPLGPMAVEILG